jgi:hypothetical protein
MKLVVAVFCQRGNRFVYDLEDAGGSSVITYFDRRGNTFPLTPALGERVPRIPTLDESKRVQHAKRGRRFPLSPKGEGWGEGKMLPPSPRFQACRWLLSRTSARK